MLYVGKAKNLKKRVSSYFTNRKNLGEKTAVLVSQIAKIKTVRVNSEIESLLLEASLIKKFTPKFNIKLADGKAYPLIRITVKHKYPAVLFSRREDDADSIYFGPFPNARDMRLVLRTIRRIFPYQSVINHPNKPCLYNHLGLCPCPAVYKDSNYKTAINYIIQFLNGETKKILKELKKERDSQSFSEHFEKADEIQKTINAIELITSPFYKPFYYELNPNLYADLRNEELKLFRQVLNKAGVKVKNLQRIECFDISNISGNFIAGSMVVFTNAEKDSSQYRKFKIRASVKGKPDDYASLKEVIFRRFKHADWPMPSLIIVDGGKGQVSSAQNALEALELKIPLIGLAKKRETIVTLDNREINLRFDSKALHLITRIRDEAHRFAINYHKKLRSKKVYE